jgi:hypothetical protein
LAGANDEVLLDFFVKKIYTNGRKWQKMAENGRKWQNMGEIDKNLQNLPKPVETGRKVAKTRQKLTKKLNKMAETCPNRQKLA